MSDSERNITFSDDKKIEVLTHALSERYNAIHIIRDRVQNVSLWTLGLFVTAAGWLIQSTRDLECNEKLYFSVIIVTTVAILRIFYFSDLERGFKNQQITQARIENALGLCKPGIYCGDSIYPQEWLNSGTNAGKGKFFAHNYLLVYTGMVILLLSVWLS